MAETERKSPWPGPEGLIPVTSGHMDDANLHNRNYLDNLLVEMRVIDSELPDLSCDIFGEKFNSPIMMPAFSHLNKVGEDGKDPMVLYAEAAKELNTVNWVGMESNEEYERIANVGARTVRIIKPFVDHEIIMDQIKFAEEHGAIAVGIDIDHIVGTDGKYDVVDGIPLGPIKADDLKKYVNATKLPFVAKGVLSVSDAIKARAAGCYAIVVSHHHGRIPFGMPPVAVLPEIKKALAGSGVHIFVDCSIDTGIDAFKALCLGAEAVSVGRGILNPLLKEGKEGVVKKVTRMNEELSEMMLYTDIGDTRSFSPDVIYVRDGMKFEHC